MSDKQGIPHITCEHLQSLRQGELEHVVVDLRDVNEYEAGHIKDAVNIPRRELNTNVENLVPDKDKKVIVIIGPIHQPEIEAVHAELKELGYRKVEFLAGGFDRWCEIAPLEIEPDLLEMTPEEEGFTGDNLTEIDPEKADDEPMY